MSGMVPFDWADPLDLESQLSDEERMIRDAARGFAQGELQPRVIEAYRDELAARANRAITPIQLRLGSKLPSLRILPHQGGRGLLRRSAPRVDAS